MTWKQVVQPDLSVQDYAGWCARFTWKVFQQQSIYNYGSAIEAWNGAGNPYPQHPDGNIPQGVAVPIYYAWGDYGHAAVFVAGQGILSSPGSGYGAQWFDSIEECGRYFGATYLGWREDMAGVPVIQFVKDPTPTPPKPPKKKGKSKMLMIHKASGDANKYRFAIFGPGFWMEFVGQDAANGFAAQIGAASVLASDAFWDFCKASSKTPINVTENIAPVTPPVAIDLASIAKAVNDDAAKRMGS